MNIKRHDTFLSTSIAFGISVLFALLCAKGYAQIPDWSIISTAPSPITPNAVSSITLRLSAASSPTRTVYCPNVFGGKGVLSVKALGEALTIEHSTPLYKVPFPGNDLFCDIVISLPPLAAGQYKVNLKFVYDFPDSGFASPEAFLVGSICVGACVIRQVPVGLSVGEPLWLFAIASLFGLGAYGVRRRKLNRNG